MFQRSWWLANFFVSCINKPMKEIKDADFLKLDKVGKKILLLYSNSCALCNPVFHSLIELEKQYNEIKFMQIDSSINKEIISEFGIVGVPCVLFLNDNQVKIYHGVRTKEEYIKILSEQK